MRFELLASGQDRAAVFPIPDGLVVALADGAGGTTHAARAAQAVIDVVRAAVHDASLAGAAPDIVAVLEDLDATPSRLGGGQTTAVVLAVTPAGITGAAIGDSGAWLVGDARPWRLDLTEHQRRKPLIGDGGLVTPVSGPPLGERTLLVASDGLLRYLPPRRIAELARGDDLVSAVHGLVAETRLLNGPDDISVVLCRA